MPLLVVRCVASVALFFVVGVSTPPALRAVASDEGWARFRGPNGAGLADTRPLPSEFGAGKNMLWRTELPAGHSSPILTTDRIFLTAFRGETLLTIAVDRRSGTVLWEREAPRSRTEKLDKRNSPASPSPVTDGDLVYVFFPDYGLLAYGVDGKERWKLPLGPFNNVYGMGASPILVDDLLVLACDHNLNSYILAVGKKDGKHRWKTERPEAKSGHSTPILWTSPQGQKQILLPGSFLFTAYAASTGEKIWWVRGLSFEIKSVPVIEGDTVYINGFGSEGNQPGTQQPVEPTDSVFATADLNKDGKLAREEITDKRARGGLVFYDLDTDGFLDRRDWEYFIAAAASENGMLAIKLGGKGDVTETNVRWKYHRSVPQLPSPLIYKNVLYMVNDGGGIVTTLNPATGAVIEQGRLKGAIDAYYASPVAADDKVFLVSQKGKVVVLKPGGSLEPIAVNDLMEDVYATPALADGRIYLRTTSALYAFAQQDK